MKEINLNNKIVLLEALDYIDRDLIAETVEDLKAPNMRQEPETKKIAVRKSIKYTLLLAACFIMLGAVIPIADYVIKNLAFFPGNNPGTTAESTYDLPPDEEGKAHYPIFTPDLEPISDEMIEEVRNAWYSMVYASEYEAYSKYYEAENFSEEDKVNGATNAATSSAERYESLLFSPNKEDHFRGRYYGIISDCVIFAFNTYLEEEYNYITLGRTTILNDNAFYILAYKDGIIKTVQDAYSAGWLNAADAEKIKERHDKFNRFGYWITEENLVYSYAKFVSDLENISDDKIEQINKALFRDRYKTRYAEWENDKVYKTMYNDTRKTKERYALEAYNSATAASDAFIMERGESSDSFEESFRYYGTFGSSVIWAEVGDTHEATEYDLEGLKFFYSTGASIKVYCQGEILDPQTAFNKGMISIDDAAKLYERYLNYESYLISKEPIQAFENDKPASEIYEEAKKGGFVVFRDAFVVAGEELWNDFYSKAMNGDKASVHIVYYYPSQSATFITTIVYRNGIFELRSESRAGGYSNLLYSTYKYIIKYEGEPIDKDSAIHRHEEVYILVNDNTLTYQKIKEYTGNLNYYIAFTKISDIKDEYTHLIPTE